MAKVCAVPDLHSPYSNLESLTLLYTEIERHKPDIVIQLGDALDMYSFSKFPKSQNVHTPKQEISEGKALLEEFWKIIHKLVPKAKKYMLVGNHEERLPKRVLERLPEFESLFSLKNLLTFKNVETVTEPEIEIDGICYFHGFYTKPYQHLRYYQRSCVFGHTHNAWVLWEKPIFSKKPLFEMSTGYLADDSMIPIQYTATKKNRWSKGYGIIDDGIPTFFPL